MENSSKTKGEEEFLGKIKTEVSGLDHLLFGGLNMGPDHVVVVIKSEEPIQGTLLGMQMLYGITQSTNGMKNAPQSYYLSIAKGNGDYNNTKDINDLLLDTIIWQCIQKMTKNYVSTFKTCGDLKDFGNEFTQFFFDTEQERTVPDSLYHIADAMICEEAMYYSSRTNALHLRINDSESNTLFSDAKELNRVWKRRFDNYSEYINSEDPELCILREKLEKKLGFYFANVELINWQTDTPFPYFNNFINCKTGNQPFIAADLYDYITDKKHLDIGNLITQYKKLFKLIILMVPSSYELPLGKIDMVIELKKHFEQEAQYLMRQASITYCRHQATALGWHQYKYRDYGLEFFPSLHTYFMKRRYLQRALVYTHSSIVTDTYQQYLDHESSNEKNSDERKSINLNTYHRNFEDYLETRSTISGNNVDSLYTDYTINYTAVNMMERILFPSTLENNDDKNDIKDYHASMTAIIGNGNTYKRFITFGSIFSSALDKEHTLIILLNKDSKTIRRRLSCPARAKRGEGCKHCYECYKYIHFMDICMGNITADEFVYNLDQQLKTKYSDGKKIKRVVIDDLQIIDYCFPFLAKDTLFLSALVNICREKNIYSYILCDKTGAKANELRAVADNILCTGRDKKGNLQIFIERFIGFYSTPSKIYCGYVKKVKDLFECYYKIENDNKKRWYYRLNNIEIDDDTVISMDDFWK